MISAARRASPKGESGTTTDDFLGGRIKVVQPKAGHRAGSDAVFLAAAVNAQAGERVLDVGAGVGVAGLCLLSRVPEVEVVAVEIDAQACAFATENAARNDFAERFTAIETDIATPAKVLRDAGLVREGYDHVIANPPFHAEGTVRAAPQAERAAAHVMKQGALGDWVRFLTTMAKPRGQLTLIHRAEALGELIALLDGRFGDLTVLPLFPKAQEPAARIIVQGRKANRAGLKLLPGLVLHGPDGAYTPEAEAVLREGAALPLVEKGRRPRGKGSGPSLARA